MAEKDRRKETEDQVKDARQLVSGSKDSSFDNTQDKVGSCEETCGICLKMK